MLSLSTLYFKTIDWSLTRRTTQWERNVVLELSRVGGEGRNTSSPKNAFVGSYFKDGLNKSQVSSVTQATLCEALAVHKHYTHYRVSLKLLYEVRKRTV